MERLLSKNGIVERNTSLVHASTVNEQIIFITLLTGSGVGGTVGPGVDGADGSNL